MKELKTNITDKKEIRNIICPAIYSCWKHDKYGQLNNYLYATMFISKPIKDFDKIFNELLKSSESNILTVKSTEEHTTFTLFEKEGRYYHSEQECIEELVIYKSLYDGFTLPYARPLPMFASEVPAGREKDNKSGQKYRFEIMNY